MALPFIFNTTPAGDVVAIELDANFAFLESQGLQSVVSTGSANSYVASPADAWSTGYSNYTGRALCIVPNFTNTGVSNLNVSSLGSADVYKNIGGVATELSAGDMVANIPAFIICDGANFFLTNPTQAAQQNVAAASINGFAINAITASTNTTAAITVAAGQAADSSNTVYVAKSGTTSWAVANGNAINGYQGGTTLPNSSTIHFFVCSGVSGTGVFASTSLTPTLPTGYTTAHRRIFSLNTNSSGSLVAGQSIEIGGGALAFYFNAPILDVATTSLSTTRLAFTLTIPTGLIFQPLYRCVGEIAASSIVILTSGNEADIAPTNASGWTVAPGADLFATGFATKGDGLLTTNTSGQIFARGAASSAGFYFATRGFIDYRRA